jgi:hypothetical protein
MKLYNDYSERRLKKLIEQLKKEGGYAGIVIFPHLRRRRRKSYGGRGGRIF